MTSFEDINKKLLTFINNSSIEHKCLQNNIKNLQKLVYDNITKQLISEGNIPLEIVLQNSILNNEKLNLLISDNIKDFLEYKITEKYEIIQGKNELNINSKIENYFNNTNLQEKLLNDANDIILNEKISKSLEESIKEQNRLYNKKIDKVETIIYNKHLEHEENLNKKILLIHDKINKPIIDIKENFNSLNNNNDDTIDRIVTVRNDAHKNFIKIEQTFSRIQAETDKRINFLQKNAETYKNTIVDLRNELNNIKNEYQTLIQKPVEKITNTPIFDLDVLKEELISEISNKITSNFTNIINKKSNNEDSQIIIADTNYLQEDQIIQLLDNKNKLVSSDILLNVEKLISTKFIELNKHVREYINNHSIEADNKNRTFCSKIEFFIEKQIKIALETKI